MRRNFMTVDSKACSVCGDDKPIDQFYLNKRKGRLAFCNDCRRASCAEYYQNNKATIKARVSVYQKENRVSATRNHRRWKAKQPPGALAAKSKARRAANPDYLVKHNARLSARREKVNEQARIRAKIRYHQDIDASRAKRRAIRAAKREYYKILGDSQRAKRHGTVGRYTSDDIAAILMAQNGRCAYCRMDIRNSFEVDHIVSFAKGGSNE